MQGGHKFTEVLNSTKGRERKISLFLLPACQVELGHLSSLALGLGFILLAPLVLGPSDWTGIMLPAFLGL